MTETENTSRRPGALIAMSGGVDSSVAAWLMPVSYTHLTLPTTPYV